MFKRFLMFTCALALVIFMACSEESTGNKADNSDIPPDPSNITVPTPVLNNLIPAATFARTGGNPGRIRVNLLGLVNPITLQPIDLFADYNESEYNFYLEEDGILKGLKLTKVSTSTVLTADIVFTVDNSGSMDEEADSVANSIIEFADFLSSSGLNVRFACIGYSVSGYVNGGVNFTTKTALQQFLNRPYYDTGTYRTMGFFGADSADLEMAASGYASEVYDENGVVAVLFADSLLSWRPGAQRVFINFTDESTQPNGYYQWSTENMCNKILGRATVHTVFSEDTTYYSGYWQDLYDERPWAMSQCTGGTVKFTDGYATGLNLADLPVAGALSNSYLVEFITASATGTHTVVLTVKTTTADGRIEYINITYN
jgi:hypothetical protein